MASARPQLLLQSLRALGILAPRPAAVRLQNTLASSMDTKGIKAQREAYPQDWQIVEQTFKLIQERLSPMAQIDAPTLKFAQAADLNKSLDLSLSENECGGDLKRLVDVCTQIVDKSVKTGSAFFFQQLYHGVDPYGLAATFLVEALHTSTYTYDVGPVVTLVEREVIANLVNLVGWKEGDGIFCPGGSMANMYAVNLARYKLSKEVKSKGMMREKRMVIFASDQSHYSVQKGAAFMGLGLESVVKIKSDSNGRMDAQDLADQVNKVKNDPESSPLMVWCTSGTTVLNGYDPLPQIHEICKENQIWMHVDACLGGAAMFSSKHRHLLESVENADSLSWCWHKVIGAPFQTSLMVTKHKGLLSQAHSASASYLFLQSKHYDTSYDTGDASLQCGRKADALKVWLMWKARGRAQISHLVDAAFQSAEYMAEKLAKNPRFRLVVPKAQGTSVCFWVIPPSLAGKEQSPEYLEQLGTVAPTLKKRMAQQSLCMVAYQPMAEKQLPNFFRATFHCHPLSSEQDVDKLIEILTNLSDDL